MASGSFEHAKVIGSKLISGAYCVALATTKAAASAVHFAAYNAQPAIGAAYSYLKPTFTAACGTIAKKVSEAPEVATGVVSAFVVVGAVNAVNMMSKRRKLSAREGSFQVNPNVFVGNDANLEIKKHIAKEVKRQINEAILTQQKQLDAANEAQQSTAGLMHGNGHKRCRDGSIKNGADADTTLNSETSSLNVGSIDFIEDAQALAKDASSSVADNGEQTREAKDRANMELEKADGGNIQPAGVPDQNEIGSQPKVNRTTVKEEKPLNTPARAESISMPEVLNLNSANAPTPDADHGFTTLRKSSSDYSGSEVSTSGEESSSSEDEQNEKRLIRNDDSPDQTNVSGSDYDEECVEKNGPETTSTQIQSEFESSQGPDAGKDFLRNPKKGFSQPRESNNQIIDLSS